jgi:hypothetical protein
MKTEGKMFAWIDADLDAAGSLLTLTWLLGSKVPYKVTPQNTFRETFIEWSKLEDVSTYDKIFILDLDVGKHLDIIDLSNVVVIDHHETHLPYKDNYKKALAIVQEYSSTCKLLYKTLKKPTKDGKTLDILTNEQKYFILLVDDYDSFQFKLKETKCLNTLFWNYQGDRVQKLCDRFPKGFTSFDETEQNICTFYEKRFARITSELQLFTAEIPINGVKYKFVAVFATEFLNDIAQYALERTKNDVALVINTKTQKVSIRRSKTSTFDCAKFAEKMGEGGGHPFASGMLLSNKVLLLSKLFTPFIENPL